MLKGLMDHWVPTQEHISKFWKSDVETVKADLNRLKKEIRFNNFTFYTKWYTNGIKSNLPFLDNCPESQNCITDNRWGNQIIDFLHENGVSAGSMLQMFAFNKNWGSDKALGEWDVRGVAKNDGPCLMADFSQPVYIERIKKLVGEQLRAFPGFDYIFFEFEGLSNNMIKKVYDPWAREHSRPDAEAVGYDDETIPYFEEMGIGPDSTGDSLISSSGLIWSIEGREMLKYYFGKILAALDETLKEQNYQGEAGVVYHMYNYEAFVYPEIIPNRDWWLLPWHYWTFMETETPAELIVARKKKCKQLLLNWKKQNHKICYIGDVALGLNGLDSIKEFYDYCVEIGIDGHLGMGNPELERGLRWVNVDDATVLGARELYKRMY
jgi:hypothetical protein